MIPRRVAVLSGRAAVVSGNAFFAATGATFPWYTGATWPPGIYFADTDTTWFAWEAWWPGLSRRQVECTTFNHTTRLWTPRTVIGTATLTHDSHGVPSLARDASGYVYCFYGAHTTPMQVSSTYAPNDPSVWVPRTALLDHNSYPHCHLVGSTFYLFMRDDTNSTERTLALVKSTSLTAGVPAWDASKTQIADMDPDSRFYQGNHALVGTDIHILATRAPADDTERRHVFYLVYDTLTGAVRNFDSSYSTAAGSLPVTYTNLNNYKLYSHASDHTGCIPAFVIDTNGHPHVIFVDGQTAGDFSDFKYFSPGGSIMHVWHNGTAWQSPVDTGLKMTGRYDGLTAFQKPSGVVGIAWAADPGALWTRGGNIYSAERSAAGVWSGASLVATAGATFAYDVPSVIRDGKAESRFMFSEQFPTETPESGLLKQFAYGDSGYLRRTTGTYVFVNSEASSYNARRTTPLTYDDSYYIDRLFTLIKAIGITKFDVFGVACDNETDAVRNLLSASYGLTKVGTAPFTAYTGWTGDGSTGYLGSGFIPSSAAGHYTQNSAHIGVWTLKTADNGLQSIGATDGTRLSFIIPKGSGNATFRNNSNTSISVAYGGNSAGYSIANRSASNANQGYRNTVSVVTGSAASTGLPTAEMRLLNVATNFSNNQIFAWHWGSSLTSGEGTDLYFAGLLPLARIWGAV